MRGQMAYGFYGKVPCVGDFIRRGLSQPFVLGWDQWMQTLLVTAQTAMGEDWEASYHNAPIWRFALSADLCGPYAVAGVVMPSIDRVGRRFPLCLATEIDAPVWTAYHAVQPSIDHLEEIALRMLDYDATLEYLENALGTLLPPTPIVTANTQTIDGVTPQDAKNAASIWVAAIDAKSCVLLAPTLPQGKAQAAAFFNLSDPCWHLDS